MGNPPNRGVCAKLEIKEHVTQFLSPLPIDALHMEMDCTAPRSGDWLHTVPSTKIGMRLTNEQQRVDMDVVRNWIEKELQKSAGIPSLPFSDRRREFNSAIRL